VVAERLCGVTRLGASSPERKRSTVKKMIIAAIGGALLSGSLLGSGMASAYPGDPRTTPLTEDRLGLDQI
jgi:hypothetical protein